MSTQHHKPTFYGTATIGTKGQVVIPAEARDQLGLNPGDKVVVIGLKDRNMVAFCPLQHVESMMTELAEKLKTIQTLIDNEKSEHATPSN